MLDLNFVDVDTPDFDPHTYIQILVTIAKADKDNGPSEYAFVRRQAQLLGLDYDTFVKNTPKNFLLEKQMVSRTTALVVLKDAIMLASMDRNFSLPEKQRIYDYAAKLDIARKDVDALHTLIGEYRRIDELWRNLLKLK